MVIKDTDKSSVVLKTTHNTLVEEFRNLEKRLEEERVAKVAAQKERDEAYLKIADIPSNVQEDLDTDKSREQDLDTRNDLEPTPLVKKALDKYNNENDIPKVNELIYSIRRSHAIDTRSEVVKYLLRIGLLQFREDSHTSYFSYFNFTQEGMEFVNQWNNTVAD